MPVMQGEVLWEPTEEFKGGTRLVDFMPWLRAERGLDFNDYEALWQWPVNDLRAFWSAVWQLFDIQADGDPLGRADLGGEARRALTGKKMALPIRQLLLGADAAAVANPGTMANPQGMALFVDLAAARAMTPQP